MNSTSDIVQRLACCSGTIIVLNKPVNFEDRGNGNWIIEPSEYLGLW